MIEDDLELAQIITDYLKPFDIEVTNTDSPYNGLSMLSSTQRLSTYYFRFNSSWNWWARVNSQKLERNLIFQ